MDAIGALQQAPVRRVAIQGEDATNFNRAKRIQRYERDVRLSLRGHPTRCQNPHRQCNPTGAFPGGASSQTWRRANLGLVHGRL